LSQGREPRLVFFSSLLLLASAPPSDFGIPNTYLSVATLSSTEQSGGLHQCFESGVTTSADGLVVCLVGTITAKVAADVERLDRPISKLIVNSNGGDVRSAMLIGRRLHKDQTVLEIRGICFSSCANYLVPAAKAVLVRKDAFIAMHGSVPRTLEEYRASQARPHPSASAEIEGFRVVSSGILAEQDEYFKYIGVDDGYILRYRELARSDDVSSHSVCHRQRKYILILDRAYLDAFEIPVLERENDTSASETTKRVLARFPNYVVLSGFYGNRVSQAEIDTLICRTQRPAEGDNATIF
jgi:hypothetical protein